MGRILILLAFLLSVGTSLAQLKGKRTSLDTEHDLFCGASIRFVSDSLAFQYLGCEQHQWFRPLTYKLLKDGTVQLDTIPADQFQPFTDLYLTELVWSAYDSIYGPSKLVIAHEDYYFTEVEWNVYVDSQLVATGTDLKRLQLEVFENPRMSFSLPRFDLFYGRTVHFHASDFSGTGDRWVIRSWLNNFDLYMYDLRYPGALVIQPEKGEKLLFLNGQFYLEMKGKRTKLSD